MKAMILAAGRGERMRPLTDTCPKPLLSVGGKPLLIWHIERLADAGITDIVINHAHLGHLIEETLGDGETWGVRIAYSPEGEALETAGGIANALPLLGGAPFLVVNGDVYCAQDFAAFAARSLAHMAQGQLAHICLVSNPAHHPEGDFSLSESGRVLPRAHPALTYSGIGAFRPELFAAIPTGGTARLAPLLHEAILAQRLSGEHFTGRWEDVGTPERLRLLDAELSPNPQ